MQRNRGDRIAMANSGYVGGMVKTPAKRRAARENGMLGGRPRSKDRCPCGEMTRYRAQKRNHQCMR